MTKTKTRRTQPVSIGNDPQKPGYSRVTDASGSEFSFRGASRAALEFTAIKLEAEAKCAAKKAAYLRAAIALEYGDAK